MGEEVTKLLFEVNLLSAFINEERILIQPKIPSGLPSQAIECGFKIAHQTAESLHVLLENKLVLQMAILARSLFELSFTLLWASLAPHGWERLLKRNCVRLIKTADRIEKHSHALPLPEDVRVLATKQLDLPPRTFKNLLDELSDFQNHEGKCIPRDWTNFHYEVSYDLLSGFVHVELLRVTNVELNDGAGIAIRSVEHAVVALLMAAHNAATEGYDGFLSRAKSIGIE